MHYFAVHFYWRFSISTRAKHDFDRRNRFSSILNLTDDIFILYGFTQVHLQEKAWL